MPPTRQATPVRSGRAEDACLLLSQVPAGGNASFVETSRGPILGFTSQNRDPHAAGEYGAWVICRIPSSARDPVVSKTVETSEGKWCPAAAFGDTEPRGFGHLIRRTTGQCVSSHAPQFPLPPGELLVVVSRRFLSRLPAALPLHTTAPRRYPVDHSIRSMHERPCGPVNGKDPPFPPPKLPVPRILGVVKSMRPPSSRNHKMCRRSRIPMSIANAGGHPHPSRRNNSKRSNTSFRPFLDVIKL